MKDELSKQDGRVAAVLIVGGVLAALFFIGLMTDWYGLFGVETKPDMDRVQQTQ